MKTLRGTLKRSIFGANARATALHWARSLFAIVLACLLVAGPLSPAFAQSPDQNPPSNPAPATSSSNIAPVSSLGVASHNYTHGAKGFPNIFKPYESQRVDAPVLTNSPRVDQLIHDGKLEISLQDAVELALENSLDIAVQRYYPWISDAGLLNAKAGNTGFATPGVQIPASSALINPYVFFVQNFDPLIQSSVTIADVTTPINNAFTSGAGTANVASIVSHSSQFNNQYSQTFQTGTNIQVNWNNTRSSSNIANFFNPDVSSTLSVSISQPLLNGFGKQLWTRNIRIANNNRKIADWAFAQQAITTITNTITAYWSLLSLGKTSKSSSRPLPSPRSSMKTTKSSSRSGAWPHSKSLDLNPKWPQTLRTSSSRKRPSSRMSKP